MPSGLVARGDTSKARYLLAGREFDTDIELQYNRARWYDPEVGRWISIDPLGFAAGDANDQRYVGNEVTGAVDPSGLAGQLESPQWPPVSHPLHDQILASLEHLDTLCKEIAQMGYSLPIPLPSDQWGDGTAYIKFVPNPPKDFVPPGAQAPGVEDMINEVGMNLGKAIGKEVGTIIVSDILENLKTYETGKRILGEISDWGEEHPAIGIVAGGTLAAGVTIAADRWINPFLEDLPFSYQFPGVSVRKRVGPFTLGVGTTISKPKEGQKNDKDRQSSVGFEVNVGLFY